MIDIIKKYFSVWNSHDLDGLSSLFSEDVELKDWDIHEIGIARVLKANSNIFKNVDSIKAEIINIAVSEKKVMVELAVVINEKDRIDVVDIFEIRGKLIKSIKAYKC